MKRSTRLSILATASLLALLMTTGVLVTPGPVLAQEQEPAQCLARDECRELKQELRGFRQELRPMRREMRQLRHQIRELPEGEERDALIERAREMHRDVKRIQRERRPVTRQFRDGCRRECFPS